MARARQPMAAQHVQLPAVAVEITRQFAAKDNSRPVLGGLTVNSREDGGMVYAADGFAVATTTLPFPDTEEQTVMEGFTEATRFVGEVIVPRSAMLAAQKLTDRKLPLFLRKEGERWLIGHYMRAGESGSIPEVWMTFKPITGPAPNYETLMQDLNDKAAKYAAEAESEERKVGIGASMLTRVSAVAVAANSYVRSKNEYDATAAIRMILSGHTQAMIFTTNQGARVTMAIMPVVMSAASW